MKNSYRFIPVLAVLIIGIVLSFFVQIQRNEAQKNSKSKELEMIVDNNAEIIRRKILTDFSSIELVRSLFENQDEISRQEFKNYTTPIFQGNLSINAISWIPKVADTERSRFELKIRNELQNEQFQITEKNSAHKLVEATKSAYYFPVTYIEPLAKNIAALGYDISSDNARFLAINKASTSNKLYISSKIKLVQDSTVNSFLGIIPVYYSNNNNEDSTSIENVKGLISAVFKVRPLINAAIELTKNKNIELLIFDVSTKAKVLIFGDKRSLSKKTQIHKRNIELGGRTWELDFLINKEFYYIENQYGYFVIGIFASLLIFLILLFPLLKEERSRILAKRLKDEQSIREKTELSLSESEEYNRTLFMESTIGLLLNTMDGKFVDANPALCKMVGRTKEEILSLTYWDLTPKKYNELEQTQLKNMAETGHYGPYEKEYIHKDGHLIPVRLQGKIIIRNEEKYIWSTVEDITERKLAQESLQESEIKYRSYFDNSLDAILLSSPDGKIYSANPAACKMIGCTENEIIQLGREGIVDVSDPRLAVLLSQRAEKGWVKGELTMFRKDKTPFEAELSSAIFVNADNRQFTSIIIRDITERKLAEKALHESNERLRLVLENMPIAIWDWDLKTDKWFATPKYYSMLGYESDESFPDPAAWLNRVHPDDRETVNRKIESVLNQTSDSYCYDDRLLHADGSYRWQTVLGNVVEFDENHHAKRMIGVLIDITERKLAEEALKKSEEEFHSLAESMPQIVWVTRPDGWNIYFNQQWVDYTGMTLEESYGEGWSKPFHPDDQQRAWDAWDNAVKNNGTYSIEVRLRRYDGEYFWWLVRGVPQMDENGKIMKWFGTCTDIEDIKMSEEKIKSQLDELMRFNSTMVDRELRMIELKKEINDYCAKLNLPEKYTIAK